PPSRAGPRSGLTFPASTVSTSSAAATERFLRQVGPCHCFVDPRLWPLWRPVFEGGGMDRVVQATIAFVDHHQPWAVPIVFVLAFCESFAFVSLVVPATGILLGVGGLIAAAELGFWPMWLAAAVGAIVGDWAAYWLAFHFKDRVLQTWPLAG